MNFSADDRGFLLINEFLQCVDAPPGIFAAGDVASSVCDPRPKAGVFAVRQVCDMCCTWSSEPKQYLVFPRESCSTCTVQKRHSSDYDMQEACQVLLVLSCADLD